MRRKGIHSLVVCCMLFLVPAVSGAKEKETFLIHLKTSLDHDDAQICVAYNMIWAALAEGFAVKVR